MTVSEHLTEPDTRTQWKCRHCGNITAFRVEAEMPVDLTVQDSGQVLLEVEAADADWKDDAFCLCLNDDCGAFGTVKDFNPDDSVIADKVRYAVELGIDLRAERVCIGEIGPFATATEALVAASSLIDRPVHEVLPRNDLTTYDDPLHVVDDPAAYLDEPIAGFTVARFTNQDGTDSSWELHGNSRRSALYIQRLTEA